jgi:hypothetical protein
VLYYLARLRCGLLAVAREVDVTPRVLPPQPALRVASVPLAGVHLPGPAAHAVVQLDTYIRVSVQNSAVTGESIALLSVDSIMSAWCWCAGDLQGETVPEMQGGGGAQGEGPSLG